MESSRDLAGRFSVLPVDIVVQLNAIAEGRGRETAARLRHPLQLETLSEMAIVQSIDASNAIEGITAPAERIEALATQRTTPRNRSEQEIAGYRYALTQIHEHAADIPFEPKYVQQLHGYVYRFTAVRHAGHFKAMDNTVKERRPDGAMVVRFVPVDAARTPAAMDELHHAFATAVELGTFPYPLLCAAYVLDFLTIHPFTDGNGRMARLITLWLLYRGGFGVGRYISLERVIAETKEDYYATLGASTVGWHENRHDLLPWARYLLGVLVTAYAKFDEQMDVFDIPVGDRFAVIHRRVGDWPSDEFTAAEVHATLRGVSRETLARVLRGLREEGSLERLGAGRGTRWRRVAGAVRWRESPS